MRKKIVLSLVTITFVSPSVPDGSVIVSCGVAEGEGGKGSPYPAGSKDILETRGELNS